MPVSVRIVLNGKQRERERLTPTASLDADPALRVFNIPASLVLGSVASSRLVLTLYSRPPPLPNPSLSLN